MTPADGKQLDLLTGKPAPPPLRPLTDRQKEILKLVEDSGTAGVMPADIGAAIHEWRSKHSADDRCRFCADDGLDALRALQKRKDVVRRKTGRWTVPKPKTVVNHGSTNDLPDGF